MESSPGWAGLWFSSQRGKMRFQSRLLIFAGEQVKPAMCFAGAKIR